MHDKFGKTRGLPEPVAVPTQLSRVCFDLRIDGTMHIIHANVSGADPGVDEETVSFDMMRLASTQQIKVRLGQLPIHALESLRYFLEMSLGIVVSKCPKFRIIGTLKT